MVQKNALMERVESEITATENSAMVKAAKEARLAALNALKAKIKSMFSWTQAWEASNEFAKLIKPDGEKRGRKALFTKEELAALFVSAQEALKARGEKVTRKATFAAMHELNPKMTVGSLNVACHYHRIGK